MRRRIATSRSRSLALYAHRLWQALREEIGKHLVQGHPRERASWKRPRRRVHPAKPKQGLRATRPDQYSHRCRLPIDHRMATSQAVTRQSAESPHHRTQAPDPRARPQLKVKTRLTRIVSSTRRPSQLALRGPKYFRKALDTQKIEIGSGYASATRRRYSSMTTSSGRPEGTHNEIPGIRLPEMA